MLPILALSLGALSACVEDDLSSLAIDFQSQIDELKNEVDGLKNDIAKLRSDMEKADAAIKAEYDEKISKINSDIESLNGQLEELTSTFNAAKLSIENDYNTKISNLKDYIDSKIAELNETIQQDEQKLTALEAKHDADKLELQNDYNQKLAALSESETAARQLLKDEYDQKLAVLTAAFNEGAEALQTQITNNKNAVDEFKEQYISEKAALELDYNTKITNLRTEYEAKVAEINAAISTANSNITALQNEMYQKIAESQNDYNNKINALTGRVSALEQITYHTVSFNTGGGTEIVSQQVIHGEKATKPSNPVRPGFTFKGWTYMDEPWVFQGYVVTEDMVITADWEYINYTVTFKNDDGTVLETITQVHYGDSVTYRGETPVKPNPEDHYTYTFTGWDVDINNIVGDTVAIAQYSAEYAPYKVIYINDDGTVLYSTYILEGETASYVGDTPTKEDDLVNQLHFQFSSWAEIERTKDTITYKARYSGCTIGVVFEGDSVYQYTGTSKSVIIPGTWGGAQIRNISSGSFAGTDVTSVNLYFGITTIEDGAFYACEDLVSIKIPSSVGVIGELNTSDSYYVDYYGAFEGCSSLKTVSLPDRLQYIGYNCFTGCSSLELTTLPSNLKYISSKAFAGCQSIKNIDLPSTLELIGAYAFSGTGLESIVIPDSVESIESYAFSSNFDLTSVTIGSGVTYIGDSAFLYCQALKEIVIPANVVRLGDNIFGYCDSLTIRVVSETKPKDWSVFWNSNCYVVWGYQFDVKTDDYTYATYKVNGNKKAVLTDINPNIKYFNPAKYVGENYEYMLTAFKPNIIKGNKNVQSVRIPDSITSIENSFCENCSKLRSVILPDSVETIGNSAFKNCSSITSITLSENITKLEYDTFMYCSQLQSLVVPNGVKSIENNCWLGCTSLKYVVLPNTIEEIGYQILSQCDSLEHVYFVGTQQEWENVSVHATNNFESKLSFIDESEIPPLPSSWIERVDNALGDYTLAWDDEKEAYTYAEYRTLDGGETVRSVAESISDALLYTADLELELLVTSVADAKEAKFVLSCDEGSVVILYSQYYGSKPTLFITARQFNPTINPVVNAIGTILNVNVQLVQEGEYGATGQFGFTNTYSLQTYGNAILQSYVAADLLACGSLGFNLTTSGMNGNNYVAQFQNASGYTVQISLLGDADKNYTNYYDVLVVLP